MKMTKSSETQCPCEGAGLNDERNQENPTEEIKRIEGREEDRKIEYPEELGAGMP